MRDHLIEHIRRFISLSDEEAQEIAATFEERIFSKKEILAQNGQPHQWNYFVGDGCLRMFLTTVEGEEHTIQFAIESWWLTDYSSFDHKKASQYSIQAMEKTSVLAITKDRQEELLKNIPKLERYFRMITQRAYSATLYRISLIYNLSKRDRYLHFVNLFPEFVQRIPQYVLASYLGISAEYISEIRKEESQSVS